MEFHINVKVKLQQTGKLFEDILTWKLLPLNLSYLL